jgi:uncharacterized protein YegL
MYKKAALVLILGVAVFYSVALTKLFLFQKRNVEPPVVTNPVPVPPITPSEIPRIDVVFLIDSTSSMDDEIQAVKDNIRNIINEISQSQPAPDVRYGIVTYRDRYDEYVTKSWPFTRDIGTISKALSSIVAAGGGDKPEDVSEGLHVTLHNMEWDTQARSKIVFLIGDAGPKNYSDGHRWEEELAFAQKNNISINTIACSDIWQQEEQIFNIISTSTNGQFARLTYKQEFAKADGSKAVVIEEGGRSYELSSDVADKDWARGASELIARNELKEMAAPEGSYGYSAPSASYALKPSVKGDELADAEIATSGKDRGIDSETSGGITTSSRNFAAKNYTPSESPADFSDRDSLAKNKKQELLDDLRPTAKPASEATTERYAGRIDAPAAALPPAISLGNATSNKTNNLSSVLTGSIQRAVRQQGATYGTLVSQLYDFKGTNSGVTTPRKVFVDNKVQLQSLLGSSTAIDINKIDFNNQVAIAVFLGQVTNNATVTISKVSLLSNDLIVTLTQTSGASSPATTPYHIVVIPRQVGSIKLDAKNVFIKFE